MKMRYDYCNTLQVLGLATVLLTQSEIALGQENDKGPQPRPPFRCTLCSDGGDMQNIDKIVFHGEGVIATDDITCGQLQTDLETQTTPDKCEEAHDQVNSIVKTDIEIFCGCSMASREAAKCEPCQPGYHIRPTAQAQARVGSGSSGKDATCRDWAKQLEALLAEDPLCQALQSQAMSDCCIPAPIDEGPLDNHAAGTEGLPGIPDVNLPHVLHEEGHNHDHPHKTDPTNDNVDALTSVSKGLALFGPYSHTFWIMTMSSFTMLWHSLE